LAHCHEGAFTVKIVSRTSLRVKRISTHKFTGGTCGASKGVTKIDRSQMLRESTEVGTTTRG
jgi:hypothetical protein